VLEGDGVQLNAEALATVGNDVASLAAELAAQFGNAALRLGWYPSV